MCISQASATDTHYLDSLKHALATGPRDTTAVICLKKIANHLRYEDAKEALVYAKQALVLSLQLDYKRGIASSYQVEGQCHLLGSDLDSALQCFRLGGLVALESGLRKLLFQSLLNAGVVYELQGEWVESARVQLLALQMAKEDGNEGDALDCEFNLGITYFKSGNDAEALDCFGHSAKRYLETGDLANHAAALDAMGNVYLRQQKYDLAEAQYEQAIRVASPLQEGGYLAPKYLNLGSVYYFKQEFVKAIATIDTAKQMALASGQAGVVADCFNNLGNCFRSIGKLDLAYENSHQALQMSQAMNRNETTLEALGNLVEVCMLQGKAAEALQHNHALAALRDSLQVDEAATELAKLQVKYEVEQHAQKVLLLQEQATNAEAKAEKNGLLLFAVAASAIALVLALMVVLLILFYRKRHAEMRLQQQNTAFALNKQALEQRALRAQMNPHFIFNSLNSIQRLYVEGDLDRAGDYMGDFATLLRKILDHSGSERISLAAELETLRLYLRLEEARLDGKLNHEIVVEDDIDLHNTLLPPMVLQPIVENAIWHGILPGEEGGKVTVSISTGSQDGFLLCTVTDDGVGIETSRRNKARLTDHDSKGIKITSERLGPGGEVIAEELPMGGTRITLKIPVTLF